MSEDKTINDQWFSIGEFSKATGLTVKTLRFYHEKGILTPSSVDESSGYRYYERSKIERARVICRLREFGFSVEEIGEMLSRAEDDDDLLEDLARQKAAIARRIRRDRDAMRVLEEIVRSESAARRMVEMSGDAVEEKNIDEMLIAGVRMTGKYSDSGQGFAQLGRAVGRYICGKPLCLYYDGEYRLEDAAFEPAFPVKRHIEVEGVSVRKLPSVKCLSVMHRGPYDQLGRSYERILCEVKRRQANVALPTREVYVKGPGMFFRGNPEKYLTEILLPVGS